MLVLMPRSVPCPSLSAIVKCARIAARSRPKMKNGLSQRHMATKPLQHRPTAREVLLYADRGLIVINKPNGLISQLSDPHNQRTKQEPGVDADMLSFLLDDIRHELGLAERPRSIHRLDKPTTGALAFACTKDSARTYSQQLSSGELKKQYLALVLGGAQSLPQKQGIIETDLECINGFMRIPGLMEGGRPKRLDPKVLSKPGENWIKRAVTEYEVVASSSKLPLSLMRLRLHTGLKHQLRVHLAQHLQTPILGDTLYSNPESKHMKTLRYHIKIPPGVYLHSSEMTFTRYSPSRFQLTIGCPVTDQFLNICKSAELGLSLWERTGGVKVNGEKLRGADMVNPRVREGMGDHSEPDRIQTIGGRWYGGTR